AGGRATGPHRGVAAGLDDSPAGPGPKHPHLSGDPRMATFRGRRRGRAGYVGGGGTTHSIPSPVLYASFRLLLYILYIYGERGERGEERRVGARGGGEGGGGGACGGGGGRVGGAVQGGEGGGGGEEIGRGGSPPLAGEVGST